MLKSKLTDMTRYMVSHTQRECKQETAGHGRGSDPGREKKDINQNYRAQQLV